MFKMGSLLAFGTVYLLMYMGAWAQERSEESSVRFTVEFYVEVITSLIDQLYVVSLFSFLIFFSHSSCRKQQFILIYHLVFEILLIQVSLRSGLSSLICCRGFAFTASVFYTTLCYLGVSELNLCAYHQLITVSRKYIQSFLEELYHDFFKPHYFTIKCSPLERPRCKMNQEFFSLGKLSYVVYFMSKPVIPAQKKGTDVTILT